MKCPNCGENIADGCKFCTNCGSEIKITTTPENSVNAQPSGVQMQYTGYNQNNNGPQMQNNGPSQGFGQQNMGYQNGAPSMQYQPNNNMNQFQQPMNKPKKKKHTGVIVLASVLAVVVAGTGVCGGVYYTSAGVKSVNYLRNAQYASATSEYNTRAANNALQKKIADPMITDYVSEVKDAYDSESISGFTALENLKAIKSMDDSTLSTLASDTYTAIDTNEQSKAAYQAGGIAYAGGNYAEAISQYVLVDPNFVNYTDAQTKITEAASKLASNFNSELDDADSVDDYEKLMAEVTTALGYLPDGMKDDAETVLASATDSYVSGIGDQFDAAVANYEGYQAAFDIIDAAIEKHDDIQGLKDLRDEKITEFEDLVLTTMDGFVANGYYAEAKDLLETAAAIAPESTKLSEYLASHGEDWITGVSELSATYWGDETYFVPEDHYCVDVYGNQYVGGNTIILSPSDYENSDALFVVDLEGKYSKMSYTISVYDDEEDGYDGAVSFGVVDSEYNGLDSVTGIKKTSKSQTRVVDVSGIDELMFLAIPDVDTSTTNISVIISDIYFITE